MRPTWLNDFLERVGGPRAISLTVWLTLGPVAVLGPIFSFPGEVLTESWPLLLGISFMSYLPSGLIFLVAYKTYLKPDRTASRPIAAMTTFFVGGASTGLLLSWLSDLFNTEPDPDYLGRIVIRGLIGLCWSSIVALLLDSRHRYLEAANQLKASIIENQNFSAERASIVEKVRAEILSLVQKTLTQVLERPTPQQLNQLADEVIRPLSREISSRSFTFDPPKVADINTAGPLPVIKRALRAPSSSFLVPAIVSLVAFLTTSRLIGLYGIVNGLLFVASWLLTVWLVKRSATKSAGVVGIIWVSGLASHLTMAAFLQNLLGGPQLFLFSANLGIWLLASFLNIQAALDIARGESLTELERVLEQTDWQRKKLQQEVWVETRMLSRYVHGDTQGRIRAAALRLDPLTEVEVEKLRRECLEALQGGQENSTLQEFLDQSDQIWQGVLEIKRELSPRTVETIEKDLFATQAVIEVIRECQVNAVKHGGAKSITISAQVTKSEPVSFVVLELKNQGTQLKSDSEPGLGSELFDEATASWTRENWESGVVVRALVPISIT